MKKIYDTVNQLLFVCKKFSRGSGEPLFANISRQSMPYRCNNNKVVYKA